LNLNEFNFRYKEAWLWVALEPIHGQILGVYISRYRNMLVTELFLKYLIIR